MAAINFIRRSAGQEGCFLDAVIEPSDVPYEFYLSEPESDRPSKGQMQLALLEKKMKHYMESGRGRLDYRAQIDDMVIVKVQRRELQWCRAVVLTKIQGRRGMEFDVKLLDYVETVNILADDLIKAPEWIVDLDYMCCPFKLSGVQPIELGVDYTRRSFAGFVDAQQYSPSAAKELKVLLSHMIGARIRTTDIDPPQLYGELQLRYSTELSNKGLPDGYQEYIDDAGWLSVNKFLIGNRYARETDVQREPIKHLPEYKPQVFGITMDAGRPTNNGPVITRPESTLSTRLKDFDDISSDTGHPTSDDQDDSSDITVIDSSRLDTRFASGPVALQTAASQRSFGRAKPFQAGTSPFPTPSFGRGKQFADKLGITLPDWSFAESECDTDLESVSQFSEFRPKASSTPIPVPSVLNPDYVSRRVDDWA